MSKLTPFEEFLSKSEIALIERWAATEYAPRGESQEVKIMDAPSHRYKIVHKQEGRTVSGLLEYPDRNVAAKFAEAMNRKFPGRFYRVAPVSSTTGRERILELVS